MAEQAQEPFAPGEVEGPSRAKPRPASRSARKGISTSLDTNGRVRRNRAVALIAVFMVFLLDQATKWVVTYPLQLEMRQTIEITDFFNLHWTENYGVSMGFLTASTELGRWLLIGLTAAIALFVAVWMWREKRRDDSIALAFVLGGALGNILDRVRFGHVVDFADLHFGEWRPFLVFNVADAAITVGVLLLVARALFMRDRKSE